MSAASLTLRVVYDTLLALHLLSAAISFITIVTFSAWAFGAPVTKGTFAISDAAWNVSGAGLLIFGVWLALYVDGYAVWDSWILGAIVLFAGVAFFGARARLDPLELLAGDRTGRLQVTIWHWLRTLALLAILVLMVWKPGA